jgi:membrane protein YqaA with SNARE-associated domain
MSLFSLVGSAAAAQHGRQSAALHWVASLGAPGVFGVSLVDATVVPLAIPGSTDLLLLWLIANGGNPYLLVSCALAGSVVGGWTTWRLGKKGGEAAIRRYVPERLQKRVQGWSQHHPLLVVFLPAVLPPPIPLAPFLLAAGALGATSKRFLAAFGSGRALRYSLMGWLAMVYGRHMIRLWSSTLQRWGGTILWGFVGLTVAGLVYGIWKLRRSKPLAADKARAAGHGNDSQKRSGATAA